MMDRVPDNKYSEFGRLTEIGRYPNEILGFSRNHSEQIRSPLTPEAHILENRNQNSVDYRAS